MKYNESYRKVGQFSLSLSKLVIGKKVLLHTAAESFKLIFTGEKLITLRSKNQLEIFE